MLKTEGKGTFVHVEVWLWGDAFPTVVVVVLVVACLHGMKRPTGSCNGLPCCEYNAQLNSKQTVHDGDGVHSTQLQVMCWPAALRRDTHAHCLLGFGIGGDDGKVHCSTPALHSGACKVPFRPRL